MKKRYLYNRDRTTLSVLGLGVVGLCFLAWRGEGAGGPRAEPPPIVAAAPNASAFRFPQQDGEGLYRAVCQGCHMSDGRGAVGAGVYPALAGNARLEDGNYPAFMIVNGQKAMPGFGDNMTDEQVAALVNFIRTSFGNDYTAPYSAKDVAAARTESSQ
ncbi:c-type cytochrome [Sphingopyxis sp. LARHCG72]